MANRKDQTELAEWNAGFVDGEGTITTAIHNSGSGESGYTMQPMVDIGNAYNGAFFDGEGHIAAKILKNDEHSTGFGVTPFCSVAQAGENPDLIKVLTGFAEEIGVDYTVNQTRVDKENHADFATVRIQDRESVRTYLETLKPYLVVKREQAEIMLEKILPRLERGDHLNKRGFLRVMYYVDEMNSHKGGTRGKYNLQYFEDLWGMECDL